MRLSASCQDTLVIHVNACEYYWMPYHWRGQLQTMFVKDVSFHNRRSIATVKRDDKKLRDERLITKQFRKGNSNVNGRRWKSSITHPTWRAIVYLVERHLKPRSYFGVWRDICGYVEKKGPRKLREGPDPTSPFLDIRADANGCLYRGPPIPDLG
ncbi:hypothetical protein ES702_05320 [subsurface metagenome]